MCKRTREVYAMVIRKGFGILTANIWVGICADAIRSVADIDQLSWYWKFFFSP